MDAVARTVEGGMMKTLDEVIIALEVCTSGYCSHPKHGDCPYLDERNDCDTRQRKLDALHYLKEFQGLSKMWNDKLDKEQANPPLTWDELRQMEGKPVWVEELGKKYAISSWFIHHGTADGYDNDEILYLQPFATFTKHTLGKTWQAYRKERE